MALMSLMSLDRKSSSRVRLGGMRFSPLVIGAALLLATGACGGKDKKKGTTPGATGSSGTVSDGTPMSPGFDPANADPEGPLPSADPNDKPPERPSDNVTDVGGDEPDDGLPEIKPPGLDISPAERKSKVIKLVGNANSALQNNRDPDRAITEAKSALLVDETSIEAMVALAHGNVIKGYYDLAEDVLRKALNRGGRSNKKAYFLLGLVYEKTKRPELAPGAYQNALTLDPDYRSALMNLGVNHIGSKRYESALKIYERLTGELGMKEASVWTNLGSAYRGRSLDFVTTDITKRNKLVLKAQESYKRAISSDKNYGNAYYNMGLLYLDADPFPVGNGEMDRVVRLKNAKTYLDEYRRLPRSNQKLVDETAAVVQKLLDREALLAKKKADREAKIRAREEKKRKQAENKKNNKDDFDSDEGFE